MIYSQYNIQKILNYHGQMHSKRFEKDFWYKCSKPNCQATFRHQNLLNFHMRIHNNELDVCQYCPYRYLEPPRYRDHLNKHFRIRDHKCEECGLTFSTKRGLTDHSLRHEGNRYCCLICNTYEISTKKSMQYHLKSNHSDLLGKNMNWDWVKKYVKVK